MTHNANNVTDVNATFSHLEKRLYIINENEGKHLQKMDFCSSMIPIFCIKYTLYHITFYVM